MSAGEREFFGLVARAAFSNPFGKERPELDRQIAGAEASAEIDDSVRERSVTAVLEEVAWLERAGRANLEKFADRDREIIRYALLFDVYHRFVNDFDALIARQVQAGDALCPVPFAGELLTLLSQRGFTKDEALRYLGFFFQVRRAFYFIHTSLVGESHSMRELRRHLWNNVFTFDTGWYERYLWNRMEDFSTLIMGETGTGKGAAAAAIGRCGYIPFDEKQGCFSESFTRNFISINLSQYPESLIESELFGHKKGAFTGAIDHHKGVFSRCSPHGAIFLDEIGDVPVPVQIKLLQILQDRTFSQVGSHEKLRFQGRVIAATNRPVGDLRSRGEFRDDFFYRLSTDTITVPPLRDRICENPMELDLLLGHVLTRTIGGQVPEMVPVVRNILDASVGRDYAWPGNVRELEQAVRRILITRKYEGETVSHEPSGPADRLRLGIEAGSLTAQELLAGYCAMLYARHGNYEEVARLTGLDRRTVKKHVTSWPGK